MLVGEALGKLHGLILEEVEVEEMNQKRVAQKVEHRCFKRIGYFRTRRIMYAGKWGEPIKVQDQEKVQRCRDALDGFGKGTQTFSADLTFKQFSKRFRNF